MILEQQEAELLIEKGFYVEVTAFGKPRKITIKPLSLETLLYCNDVAVKLKDNFLNEKSIPEYIAVMNEEIILKSEYVACAYLHSGWRIKLFKKPIAWFLRKGLTSKKITNIIIKILEMYDLGNFTASTRMMTRTRATKPKTERVE